MQRPAWTPGKAVEPHRPPPPPPQPAASSWPETLRCAPLPPVAWGRRERDKKTLQIKQARVRSTEHIFTKTEIFLILLITLECLVVSCLE